MNFSTTADSEVNLTELLPLTLLTIEVIIRGTELLHISLKSHLLLLPTEGKRYSYATSPHA